MKLDHYLYNDSFEKSYHPCVELLRDQLTELDKLVQHAIDHREPIWVDDSFYDVEILDNQQIVNWAYEPSQDDGMDDMRWLLIKILESTQSADMASVPYQDIKTKIETEQPQLDTTLMCLHDIHGFAPYVHNIEKWRSAHTHYLLYCHEPQMFVQRAGLCFPNLYFHDRVAGSMETLSAPLSEYTGEIIRHLVVLNDEAPEIYREYHHEGDQSMLERFSVEASPERRPEVVRDQLTYHFPTGTGGIESIKCGPHTKLNGQGRRGSTEYLFDRIYFGWGRKHVQDGKILVAHIGKHRE